MNGKRSRKGKPKQPQFRPASTDATVDFENQCRAITRDGHQCTRPGVILTVSGFLCGQHGSSGTVAVRRGGLRHFDGSLGAKRRPKPAAGPKPATGPALRPTPSMPRATRDKFQRQLQTAVDSLRAAARAGDLSPPVREEVSRLADAVVRIRGTVS